MICDNYNAQSKGANRREEALVNGGEERVLWLFRFPFFRGWIGNIGNNVESKIVVFEREREHSNGMKFSYFSQDLHSSTIIQIFFQDKFCNSVQNTEKV